MFKRIAMFAVLGVVCVAGSLTAAKSSEAGVFFRPIAPVRRAARVALPPYPVARRVVAAPLYRPVYRPVVAPVYGVGYAPAYGYGYAPVYGGAPYGYGYGTGVSVSVGY
jgi:hypothetical protein